MELLEEGVERVGNKNRGVGEVIELVHQCPLIRIWLAQHGVQRRYHWHMYVAQKSKKVAAGGPAVDAKLVLDQDHLHVVDIEEIGCAAIRIEFLLINLKPDPGRIVVAFGSVIDRRNDAPTFEE